MIELFYLEANDVLKNCTQEMVQVLAPISLWGAPCVGPNLAAIPSLSVSVQVSSWSMEGPRSWQCFALLGTFPLGFSGSFAKALAT